MDSTNASSSSTSNSNLNDARSTSNDQPEQAENISCIDSKLIEAAAKGNISSFNGYAGSLDSLRTPSGNTILHICISARRKSANPISFILHICISANSITFINEILRICPSLFDRPNARDEIPLHIAARYGHEDIVKVLIEKAKAQHEDPELGVAAAKEMLRKITKEKDTALHEAVRSNHLQVVRILIKEDALFCYLPNDAGETPLYLAAERGYGDIVAEILDNCKSIRYDGPNGRTALHEAAINNGAEMTRRLIKKNASLVQKPDQQGWTPLHHAAHFGHLSIVKQLLKSDKSTAYTPDQDGKRTPLHIAAGRGLGFRHVKVMKRILSYCPDCCEVVDDRGRNVFHFAVESYSIRALDVLLQNQFTSNLINQKDNEGNTPLHLLAALRFDCRPLIRHPLVDKKSMNKKNLTAADVLLDTTEIYKTDASRLETWLSLRKAGCKRSTRNKISSEDGFKKEKVFEGIYLRHKEARGSHLIVATLIATVTFAAGFAMPGGYINEKGEDTGTAILSKKAAFQLFVVLDGCAFVLSTSVVLMHFLLAMQVNIRKFFVFFNLAFWLILIATICMVLAFGASRYAVLPDSSKLRVTAWIFSGCFFAMLILILSYSLPFYFIDYVPKTQATTSQESETNRDG